MQWPHYDIIHQTKQETESLLQGILTDISTQTKDAIYTYLTELLDKKGIYWATARKLFEIQCNKAAEKKLEQPNETLDSSILDQGDDDYEITDNIETMDENDSLLDMECTICDTKEQEDPKTDPEHDPDANTAQTSPENKDTIQQNVIEQDSSMLKSGVNRFKVERVNEPKLGQFKALPKSGNSKIVPHESEAVSKTEAQSAQSGTEPQAEVVQWADSWGFSSLQEILSNGSYYLNLLVSLSLIISYETKLIMP